MHAIAAATVLYNSPIWYPEVNLTISFEKDGTMALLCMQCLLLKVNLAHFQPIERIEFKRCSDLGLVYNLSCTHGRHNADYCRF